MGFFGSLFEKRQCSICGKEMGLTERKELSGGNLCRLVFHRSPQSFHSPADQGTACLSGTEQAGGSTVPCNAYHRQEHQGLCG